MFGRSTWLALVAGVFLWLAAGAVGGAHAGPPAPGGSGSCGTSSCGSTGGTSGSCGTSSCGGGGGGCGTGGGCGGSYPKPPPKPPSTNCCAPNHNVMTPGLNVYVAPSVVINAGVSAQVDNSININAKNNASSINSASAYGTATANAWNNAGASGGATASGGSSATGYGTGFGYGACCGGGGQSFYTPPMATGMIQGMMVEGRPVAATRRVAYQATRTTTRRVVIQAFCLDDRDVPHPASQVTPDREIDSLYDGELYRCLAGTRMQYVVAEFNGRVAFDGGQTIVCGKNEALYHAPGGRDGASVACRPQKAARDCNERSLLRRFGAGVKILAMVATETYTAYRDEVVMEQMQQAVTMSMSLDGGVGGVAF